MKINITLDLSDKEKEELLDKASYGKAIEMIPLDIVLIIFGIIGLVGNILSIKFYSKKAQLNPTTRLISALAGIDTISCLIMPNHIVATFMIYKFSSTTLCALSVGLAYTLTICSGGFLLFIGIFRYKLVCMPLRPQFTLRQANYFIGIAVALALTLATPTLAFYRSEPFEVVINENITVPGTECNVAREPTLEVGFVAMNIIHAVVFFTTSILLLIMYAIMGKNIWEHNKRRAALLKTTRAAQSPNLNRSADAVVDEEQAFNTNPDRDKDDGANNVERKPRPKISTTSDKSDANDKGDNSANPDRSSKITKLCFVIYLSFIGSFVPYLALSFHKFLNPEYDSYSLFSKVCYRSFMFNNVANPFIYGFFNLQFRDYVKQILLRRPTCLKRP